MYLVTVYHCTYRGDLAKNTVGEIFSFGFGVESGGTADEVATQLVTTWTTIWNAASYGMKNAYNAAVVFQEATAAQVLSPEKPTLAAAVHKPFNGGAGLAGANGSMQMLPTQCAIAVSLKAGVRPNGTPLRGRFYLPPVITNLIDQDGRLGGAVQADIKTAIVNWIGYMKTNFHYVSVTSGRYEITQPVTEIRIGNRIDTIRRRANKGPETYVVGSGLGPTSSEG